MIAHLQGREAALEPFGWTGRQAEWIALAVSTAACSSAPSGPGSWMRITNRCAPPRPRPDRARRGHRRDRARRSGHRPRVPDLSAGVIYRALGAEDIRHRRAASEAVLMRRLLSLDYVLEHPGLPWLPTESEKVGAFEALGIERRILPSRLYRGAAGNTRRYFPLK